jgi:uncharacterized membrane protein YkvA (DUF1232 family)
MRLYKIYFVQWYKCTVVLLIHRVINDSYRIQMLFQIHLFGKEINMADRKKIVVPPQGGMMRDLVRRLKLITRLMGDGRVNIFVKILPLASLAYLFWPLDAIALPIVGALDDAAILWVGSTLFVELCPRDVVNEHMQELAASEGGEVVDAEATDIDNK